MAKVVRSKAAKPEKKRKKTKAEKHREQWSVENMLEATSVVMQSTMEQARAHFKDEAICTAGEASRLVLGIPLPSFAMEYLIQNTVWPLERVSQIVGIQGTSKSGFTYEVARWFRKFARGAASVFEHESKYSPDWCMSHIGWDDPNAIGVIPCKSVDDWQHKMTWMIDQCQRAMTGTKANPGSGRKWPWLGIIDSVTGKAAAETQENIRTRGSAGRARPLEALLITQYLRSLPEQITGWPFAVLAVNHLKPDKDPHTFQVIRNKSGGRGLDFMETLELELSARAKKKIRESTYDGTRLQLSCKKNSLGITDRSIPIDVIWWEEQVYDAKLGDTAWRQVTKWDWHSASIQLLMQLPEVEKARSKALAEILRIEPVKTNEKGPRVACKALGISKSSPVTLEEAGMILSETPDILDALRRLYGVKIREAFRNDLDYRKQRVLEKRRIKERIAAVTVKPECKLPKTPVAASSKPHKGKLVASDDEIEIEAEPTTVDVEEDGEIEIEA